MRPLTGARRVKRERLTAPAGVGAPRATQARSRSGSRRGQGIEWPALPTTMTCRGQGGETYQIPIAPPLADDELVGVRGSTLASIEYTGQSLELTASVMGMLQRSLDLLSIYSIPISSFNISPKTLHNLFHTDLMHHIINTVLGTLHSYAAHGTDTL